MPGVFEHALARGQEAQVMRSGSAHTWLGGSGARSALCCWEGRGFYGLMVETEGPGEKETLLVEEEGCQCWFFFW